jgi:hypothetical protein
MSKLPQRKSEVVKGLLERVGLDKGGYWKVKKEKK